MHYYNKNDPFLVEWLHNLIEAGHLPQLGAEFIIAGLESL